MGIASGFWRIRPKKIRGWEIWEGLPLSAPNKSSRFVPSPNQPLHKSHRGLKNGWNGLGAKQQGEPQRWQTEGRVLGTEVEPRQGMQRVATTGLDVHSRLTIPKRAQRIKLPGSLFSAKVSFQMMQETQDTQIDSHHFPWLCLVKMTSCFFFKCKPPTPRNHVNFGSFGVLASKKTRWKLLGRTLLMRHLVEWRNHDLTPSHSVKIFTKRYIFLESQLDDSKSLHRKLLFHRSIHL